MNKLRENYILQDQTTMTLTKHVYKFGNRTADGDASMKALLGGKGANLAEMCSIGIPVPPGFTITTEVCTAYSKKGKSTCLGMIKDEDTRLIHVAYHTLRVLTACHRST